VGKTGVLGNDFSLFWEKGEKVVKSRKTQGLTRGLTQGLSRGLSRGLSLGLSLGLSRGLSQTRIYTSIYMFIFCIYQYIIVYTIYDYFIPCYCFWWYGSLALRLSVVYAGTY
jgi:hypothetical protein